MSSWMEPSWPNKWTCIISKPTFTLELWPCKRGNDLTNSRVEKRNRFARDLYGNGVVGNHADLTGPSETQRASITKQKADLCTYYSGGKRRTFRMVPFVDIFHQGKWLTPMTQDRDRFKISSQSGGALDQRRGEFIWWSRAGQSGWYQTYLLCLPSVSQPLGVCQCNISWIYVCRTCFNTCWCVE